VSQPWRSQSCYRCLHLLGRRGSFTWQGVLTGGGRVLGTQQLTEVMRTVQKMLDLSSALRTETCFCIIIIITSATVETASWPRSHHNHWHGNLPICSRGAKKELWAVCVRARVCHWQSAWICMFQGEILIFKFLPIYWSSACSIVVSEVSTLAHLISS
jgi:hypothetical protein